MKLKKIVLFILCLVFSASLIKAGNSGHASIKAQATVIPMLGIRSSTDNSQALCITEKYDSEIFIQAPKNSELFVSLTNSSKQMQKHIVLSSQQSVLYNNKNSVLDILPLDLLQNQIKREELHIITITRIDN